MKKQPLFIPNARYSAFLKGGGLIPKAAFGDDSTNWTDNPDTIASQGEIRSDDRAPVERWADDIATAYRNSDFANSAVAKTLAYMTPYGIVHFAMGDRENGLDPLMTGLSIVSGFNPAKGIVPAVIEGVGKIGTKVGTKLRPFVGKVAQAFQRPIIKNGITEAEMAANKVAANSKAIPRYSEVLTDDAYLKRLASVAKDEADFRRLLMNNRNLQWAWKQVNAGKNLGAHTPEWLDQFPAFYNQNMLVKDAAHGSLSNTMDYINSLVSMYSKYIPK